MRLSNAKACRSAWGQGLFCCALLLVGTYVLFDILDVDGSQLVRRPASAILVVETPQGPADRFARPEGSAPGAGGLSSPLVVRLLSVERGGSWSAPSPLRLPLHTTLPRVNLHPERALSSSCSADPL